MSRYILRRLLQAIPTFFGITILSFSLMAASGNPVQVLAFQPDMTPEEFKRIGDTLGVNDPLPIQYLRWLLGDDWMRWDTDGDGKADRSFLLSLDPEGKSQPGTRRGILRGDFGNSFVTRRPVLDLLTERIPATLELNIITLILGTSLGLLVGIIAALNRGKPLDHLARFNSAFFNAIPLFWFALLALLFFGAQLRILPLGDRCKTLLTTSCPPILMRLEYLVLPVSVIVLNVIADVSRLMRTSILDVIGQDYIRTAQAKGLRRRGVWLVHATRNALIPIVTGLGPAILALLGGSIVIETIFNWPGVGQVTFSAAIARDYPMVMANVIYAAFVTIVGYMISDILYSLVDPRIRFS